MAGGPIPLPGKEPMESADSSSSASSSGLASAGRWGSLDMRAPMAER
jgi:hypothetical protein